MNRSIRIPLFPQMKKTRIQGVVIDIEVLEVVVEFEVDCFFGNLVLHMEDHGCFCEWDVPTLVVFVAVIVF